MGCGTSKRIEDDIIPLQNLPLTVENKSKSEKEVKENNFQKKKDESIDIYANTATGDYKNQKNREFLELSHLSDLPDYQANIPNFDFKNGELSPIDLNRDNKNLNKNSKRVAGSQHLISDQENKTSGTTKEQQRRRIVRVKLRRNEELKWPEAGELEIKTINYKVVYSHEAKGFRVLKSKDYYLTSLMTWKKDHEEDLFNFVIQDTASTNLRSGNTQDLPTPPLKFQVNYDGKFLGIIDLGTFVESILNLQSTGKITKNRHLLLQKKITREIEKTWNLMVQEWILENRSKNQDPLLDKRAQFGKDCSLFNKTKISDDKEYRDKIKEKLTNIESFYKILSSSKMIKDKFKKWELHKDSKPRDVYLDQEEAVSHRSLKLNFISTDKNEVFTVLNESSSMRPFISNYENSKNIVFEMNKDIYVDVEYEAKMNIYLWKDIEELQSDDFLISEMVKFQDACNTALGDLLAEISHVPKIPLRFRIKNPIEDKIDVEEIQKVNLSKIR